MRRKETETWIRGKRREQGQEKNKRDKMTRDEKTVRRKEKRKEELTRRGEKRQQETIGRNDETRRDEMRLLRDHQHLHHP